MDTCVLDTCVADTSVVDTFCVGVGLGLVATKPSFISLIGTPNTASRTDLEIFTTWRRVAAGITDPP